MCTRRPEKNVELCHQNLPTWTGSSLYVAAVGWRRIASTGLVHVGGVLREDPDVRENPIHSRHGTNCSKQSFLDCKKRPITEFVQFDRPNTCHQPVPQRMEYGVLHCFSTNNDGKQSRPVFLWWIMLQQSPLITRKQLAALSGSNVDKRKCSNPLKLGTPIGYCGGGAMGTKCGLIHHICIIEGNNRPPPKSHRETFILYRFAPKEGGLQRDVVLFEERKPEQKAVPIFLEPAKQPDKLVGGKGVKYLGHWKYVGADTTPFEYGNRKRCAALSFKFSKFDGDFNRIIEIAHDKTIEEIRELKFDSVRLGASRRIMNAAQDPQVVRSAPLYAKRPAPPDRSPPPNKKQWTSADSDSEWSAESDARQFRRPQPRPQQRQSRLKKEPPKEEEQRKPRARETPTVKRENESKTVEVIDLTGNDNHGPNSVSPSHHYYKVLLEGDDDSRQFIFVNAAAGMKPTFADLRQAIVEQLVLPSSHCKYQFCVHSLGLVDPKQEHLQVAKVMPDRAGDGSPTDPYTVTIAVAVEQGAG